MFNLIANWRREREAVRELSRLSDRELADLGIARSDIRAVAEGAAVTMRDETLAVTVRAAAKVGSAWATQPTSLAA